MSIDCSSRFSCPRSRFSVRSWRAFAIAWVFALSYLGTCGVALGMPAESVPDSSSERSHDGSLEPSGSLLGDSAPDNTAKTETPPSEEDPEVDEIDPFTGGLDGLLMHWFKGLANLLG